MEGGGGMKEGRDEGGCCIQNKNPPSESGGNKYSQIRHPDIWACLSKFGTQSPFTHTTTHHATHEAVRTCSYDSMSES